MTSVVAKDDLWCAVASSMCVRIYFGWNLQYVRYIFRLCRFFSSSPKNDDWNYLPFGVNYVSVAQKLRILAILPIFDPKHSFLADDRRKIKAEILSFEIRCYVCKVKLRVPLRVATNKNASCVLNWRWKLWLGSNTGVTSIPSNWGHIILNAWKDHDSIVKWCMCDPLEISLLHMYIHAFISH